MDVRFGQHIKLFVVDLGGGWGRDPANPQKSPRGQNTNVALSMRASAHFGHGLVAVDSSDRAASDMVDKAALNRLASHP